MLVALSEHRGMLIYHCRRCDTHVAISAESLGDRDITKLCLCGQGVLVSEDGQPVTMSRPFPVKPRRKEHTDPDDPIERREAAAREKHQDLPEWEEAV